jgi:IS30 family transposase
MGTHYAHVTQDDRISIQALMQAQLKGPEIARRPGLSRSTINRDINRSKVLPTAVRAGLTPQQRLQQPLAGALFELDLGGVVGLVGLAARA